MSSEITKLKNLLGKPYYEEENVLLFLGDCQEVLSRIGTECFDLVITSPPYNIGKEYELPLSLSDYIQWCGSWMSQLFPFGT